MTPHYRFWLYVRSTTILLASLGLVILLPAQEPRPSPTATLLAAALYCAILLSVALSHRSSAGLARSARALGRALADARAGQIAQLAEREIAAELRPLARGWNDLAETLDARQRALEAELRRTALLTRLSIELRASLDAPAIIRDALGAIVANTDAGRASILLIAPDGSAEQACVAGGGPARAIDPARARTLAGGGLAGWALRHGRNVALADVAADDRWLRFGEGQPAGGAMALLLRHERATLGVLTITHPARGRFTSHDLLMFEGAAAQIGVALSAARRHADERQRREQALALFAAGQLLAGQRTAPELAAELLARSAAVFGVDQAALFLADHATGALELAGRRPDPPAGDDAGLMCGVAGAAEIAWRGQRPITRALAGGPAGPSAVALPLLHNGAAIGALVLLRDSGAAAFSADTWSLLTMLANVAAATFANLRLLAQLQLRARALRRLVDARTAQLRQSRDLLRIIFDHLPDGLVLTGADQRILMANPAFCAGLLGRPAGAVIGQHLPTILRALGQSAAQPVAPPADPERRGRALVRDPAGRERWFAVDRYAVADGDRAIERWRDVTRQEQLHHQLLQHEQLTSMARLAASVVHEVGNPLQSVRSCLDLCREDRSLAPGTAEYLDLANAELERMAGILSRLRDLYRPPQLVWEHVDLNKLAVVVRHLTARQFAAHGVEIDLELAPDLPMVRAQPDPLRQVLLNLLLNAQDAMAAGGRIRIATAADPERRAAVLSVRDTGAGIGPDRLAQIFDPFSSGKPHGLGLGLYISKQVVEQHRGCISIASAVGAGTTVTVVLPWWKVEEDAQSELVDRR